jgi:hypothetical protein
MKNMRKVPISPLFVLGDGISPHIVMWLDIEVTLNNISLLHQPHRRHSHHRRPPHGCYGYQNACVSASTLMTLPPELRTVRTRLFTLENTLEEPLRA